MKKTILMITLISIFACQKENKQVKQDYGHAMKSPSYDTIYGSDSDSGSLVMNDYSMTLLEDGFGSVTINRTLDQSNSSSYGAGLKNLTLYSWIDLVPGWILDVEDVTEPVENQVYVWFVPFSPNSPPIIYNDGRYTGPQKAYYCQCAVEGQPLEGSCTPSTNDDGTRNCKPNTPTSCSNCKGYTFYSTGGVYVMASSLEVDGSIQ